MLTKAQITEADGFLDDVAIAQWLTLFRSLPRYREQPGLYPNLEAKLASLKQGVIASSNVIKAKILNAALAQIEGLGPGEESTGSPTSAGASWSRGENRNAFITDALNILYPVPMQRPTSAVRRSSSGSCSIHGCALSMCASAGRGCAGGARLIF